jgi:hypothetical protein
VPRLIRLVRIALSAETIRLRHLVWRGIGRSIVGVIALALLFAALLLAHVSAWYWLWEFLPTHFVALILAAVDLLLAVALALVAARSSPGEAERAAAEVRDRALYDAVDSLSISALLIRLIDLLLSLRSRG